MLFRTCGDILFQSLSALGRTVHQWHIGVIEARVIEVVGLLPGRQARRSAGKD